MDVPALSVKEEKKHMKYCYPFLKVPRERPPLLERLQALCLWRRVLVSSIKSPSLRRKESSLLGGIIKLHVTTIRSEFAKWLLVFCILFLSLVSFLTHLFKCLLFLPHQPWLFANTLYIYGPFWHFPSAARLRWCMFPKLSEIYLRIKKYTIQRRQIITQYLTSIQLVS